MVTAFPNRTKWTAEAYFASSQPGDGRLYEILNGELIKRASPTLTHQAIIGRLCVTIGTFLETNRIGQVVLSPLDVQLGESVVIPDLVFIGNDRKQIITYERLVGAPSLIVEVLSLLTIKHDLFTKPRLYAEHGVSEYWRVNPESQTIEVLILEDDSYTVLGEFEREDVVQSQVLVGFEMIAADLFTES